MHGGAAATLVDIVGSIALVTGDRDGRFGVSTDLNVTWLAPAPLGAWVQVEAQVLKVGKTMGYVAVDIRRESDGALAVQGRMTKHPRPPRSSLGTGHYARPLRRGVSAECRYEQLVVAWSGRRPCAGSAAGCPDRGVLSQCHVHQRLDRRRVPDRGDAADVLTGGLKHELRSGSQDSDSVPTSVATFAVSTRCDPLVITSSGSPEAVAKISEFAMAPTSTPTIAAAMAAVGAASLNI